MKRCGLALLLALTIVPTAHAAPWRAVTEPNQSSVDQPGLVRTSDGVLHVAWSRPLVSGNTEDLLHTAIAANGRVGTTSTIAPGWTGFQNAALVLDPAGIRAFAGAMRSTTPGEAIDEMATFLSLDGGANWTPQEANVVPDGGQAYGYPTAAASSPAGRMLQTWAGTLGTWVHEGLTAGTPIHNYQDQKGQYGYDSNIAIDGAGNAMLAWYSSGAAERGVLAQPVGALGAPAGGHMTMPGTGNMTIGMLGLTPLVARSGGGFYVAYPVGRRVQVWRVGASRATGVGRTRGMSPAVTLAAAADGRLWAAWVAPKVTGPVVMAVRSNRAATRWGTVVSAGRPRGSQQAYRLSSNAIGGALDILANFNQGTSSTTAIYHRRVLPGLKLVADPRRLRRGVTRDVVFRVTDAGDPVQNARVRVGGISGRTNAGGRVTLTLPGRTATARATKQGYKRALRRLRAVQ